MNDDPAWAQRRARQAAAFDAIGTRYDEAFPHKEGQLAAGRWLLARLPAGARILDAGCGTGMPTAHQLVDGDLQVTGIDISPAMLRSAAGNVPQGHFQRLDLLDLPTAGLARFDAAVAFFSLLMLPKAHIPRALGILHDALEPDGLLALSMVVADLDDTALPFLGQPLRLSGYPRDQLRTVVETAGFAVEHTDTRSYAPASPDAPDEVQIFLCCRHSA